MAWLLKKGQGHPVIQFYVSRIEKGFLSIIPAPKEVIAVNPQEEWIFFADKNGEVLFWKEKVRKRTSRLFFWRKELIEEEVCCVPHKCSVGDVLSSRLGDRVKEIYYAVSWYSGTLAVIVYKSPKDFSIVEWLEALKKKAEAEVAEEVRKIDEEPTKLGIR